MCCWHQKQQIIPLRFFEALYPYADGIRGGRKFRCGVLRRLILIADGIRGGRKFRCGFLRRLIHMLMASKAVENSAAVSYAIDSCAAGIRNNR